MSREMLQALPGREFLRLQFYVHVSVVTDQGTVLENGNAVETAEGSGRWVYTATTNVPGETRIVVNVVATDRPGGTAVKTQNVNF